MTLDQFALIVFFGGILIHAINTYAEVHQPEEEEEMAYQIEPSSCDEDSLLATKLKCLKLACIEGKSTETVIADATKFWDFLTADAAEEA